MLPEVEYVAWAHARYGRVRYDLACSNVPHAPASMLGDVELDSLDGHDRFAAAVAERYGVRPAEVLPTLGTSQAIWLACVTLLSPGDEVLVETPGYEPLWRVPEGLGARVRRFPRHRADGYRLDPAEVAAAIGPDTRLVLVSNLHNPSGALTGATALEEVAGVAARVGAALLVDEVYGELGGEGFTTGRLAGPNAIAVSSLTKCWGLAWARAGWLIAPEDVVRRAHVALRHTTGWNGTAHAVLGARAMERREAFARRAAAEIGDKLDLVDTWVRSQPRLSWTHPGHGIFGLVHVDGATDLRPLIERVCDEEGAVVAPGAFFGEPAAMRIGCGAPAEVLEAGLSVLTRRLADDQ